MSDLLQGHVESLARDLGRLEGLVDALERRVRSLEGRNTRAAEEVVKKWEEARSAQMEAVLRKRSAEGVPEGGDAVTDKDIEADRSGWMLS